MIYGIGADITSVARFKHILSKYGDKFAGKILSNAELNEYQKIINKANFLAKRFAAKEAFGKAIGTGISGFWFTDLTITHDSLGKPEFLLSNNCLEIKKNLKIAKFYLTISDDKNNAVAFVIAEC